MQNSKNVTVLFLSLAVAICPLVCLANGVPDVTELNGYIGNAEYKIVVPSDWNGTLLVYAHGYGASVSPPNAAPAPIVPPSEDTLEIALLKQGYALAGSRFKADGFAVKEGVQNTLALTNFFRGHVGNPERIIVWGNSMGGLITALLIEKFPGIYDGGISACGVVGGAPQRWDRSLALDMSYALVFGWPAAWGSVEDINDDVDWDTEVAPVLMAQHPIFTTDPSNFPRWEFIRIVNGFEEPLFYPPSGPFFLVNMWFGTIARAEVEARARGPMAQNLDHYYTLTPEQILYLNGLFTAQGLPFTAESLLNDMNLWRIQAKRSARNYIVNVGETSGNIKRPVITLHNILDPLVPVSDEYLYRQKVQAENKLDLLMQVYTNLDGHCNFTRDQMLDTVEAMDWWLTNGTAPSLSLFDSPGFDHSFIPPAPPF